MLKIIGTHSIIYSTDAEADRAFLRDVIGLPYVDAHDGWLIFGLPPSELAVHPWHRNGLQEFYLLCDDVKAFVQAMRRRGIKCTRIKKESYGITTELTLPGGGALGVYQPLHSRPNQPRTR